MVEATRLAKEAEEKAAKAEAEQRAEAEAAAAEEARKEAMEAAAMVEATRLAKEAEEKAAAEKARKEAQALAVKQSKWAAELATLDALGFDDTQLLSAMLDSVEGDLQRVARTLLMAKA